MCNSESVLAESILVIFFLNFLFKIDVFIKLGKHINHPHIQHTALLAMLIYIIIISEGTI